MGTSWAGGPARCRPVPLDESCARSIKPSAARTTFAHGLNIKLNSARGEPVSGAGTTLAMDDMSSVEDERREELRRQAERRHELEGLELAKLQQAKHQVQ